MYRIQDLSESLAENKTFYKYKRSGNYNWKNASPQLNAPVFSASYKKQPE